MHSIAANVLTGRRASGFHVELMCYLFEEKGSLCYLLQLRLTIQLEYEVDYYYVGFGSFFPRPIDSLIIFLAPVIL